MTLADFRSGVFDAFDHVLNVLFGQTRMHGQVHFAFVEEFRRDRALVGIVAHPTS